MNEGEELEDKGWEDGLEDEGVGLDGGEDEWVVDGSEEALRRLMRSCTSSRGVVVAAMRGRGRRGGVRLRACDRGALSDQVWESPVKRLVEGPAMPGGIIQ